MADRLCPCCEEPFTVCNGSYAQSCWQRKAEKLQAQLDQRHQEQEQDTVERPGADDDERLQSLERRFGASARLYRQTMLERNKATLPLHYNIRAENLGFLLILARRALSPVPILMECPMCKTKHIDEDEFATKKHHTHACQGFVMDHGKRRRCGHVWRPALVPTVGVEALPGFINEEPHAER